MIQTKKKKTEERDESTSPVPDVQKKFETVAEVMGNSLVERYEEIDLALTALLAQEHLLLIGVPGTAKSLLAETLKSWITGTRSLTVHCSKDTSRNSVFGPVKLSALKNDKMDRVLEGGLADSHIVILEELFKAGPAVLDMFLMLLNERVYKEGLVSCKTPLRFVLGASNEWSPEGCETALAAFFDRFLFRKSVKPVSRNSGRRALLSRAVNNDPCKPKFKEKITLEEVDQAHKEVLELPFTDNAKKVMWQLCLELDKVGVTYGDRRLSKSITAVRAYAYLKQAKQVEVKHLEILQHVLWSEPTEQPGKCAQIVLKVACPDGAKANSLWLEAEDVMEKAPSASMCVVKLEEIIKSLEALDDSARKDRALNVVKSYRKDKHLEIIGSKK